MLCPNCQEVLSQVAVPSYRNSDYHCDNCGKYWWRRVIRSFCPRCRRMSSLGHRLVDHDHGEIVREECPECLSEEGKGD